jgi:ubiquinone/menaquinone biosynthesis C-methylase UbiE
MSSERLEDNVDSPWWGEHIHRYDYTLNLIKDGSCLLDIACGTGFGTFKLFKNGANSVTGGDVSQDALDYCKHKYSTYLKENKFEFRYTDATKLDFRDNTFDAIISFETLEHIPDYKKVISEFHRVLKPDGLLILSTPNRDVSSPDGIIRNPYHTQEFTFSELKGLLSDVFQEVKLGGQKYVRYDLKSRPIAHLIEKFFYLRGIRKLGLGFKNAVMKLFGIPVFYPVSTDYDIKFSAEDIKVCLTLFAICRKSKT